MLEKDSKVTLTQEDLEQYNRGIVSKRLAENWGLSYLDLKQIINTDNYRIIHDN